MSSCIDSLSTVERILKDDHWPLCVERDRFHIPYSGFYWGEAPGDYDFWDEEVRPGEPISEQAKIYLQTMIDAHKLGV